MADCISCGKKDGLWVEKTLAQRAKSSGLDVRRQAIWGISAKDLIEF
jgi:hypothetical protein